MPLRSLILVALSLVFLACAATAADKDFLFYQYDATGKPKERMVTPTANYLLRFNASKDLVPWALSVASGQIASGAVTTTEILDGTVASTDIADATITSTDIADGAISAAKLAAGVISGGVTLTGRLPDLASYKEIMRQELNTEGRFVPETAGYVGGSYGSGVAWHPTRQKLYVVDNAGPGLMEFTATGKWLRTITLSGFDDVEAICWMGPNQGSGDQFALAEEVVTSGGVARGAVVVCTIPDTGSVTLTKGSGGNWVRTVNPQWTAVQTNLGLEALGVDYSGTGFWATTEKAEVDADWKLYSFANTSGNQTPTAQADLATILSGVANDISDLKVIQPASGQLHFLLLSHEGTTGSTGPGKLIDISPNTIDGGSYTQWRIHSTLTLPAAFTVSEGVDTTPDGRTIFVTSEKGADNMAKLLILQAP